MARNKSTTSYTVYTIDLGTSKWIVQHNGITPGSITKKNHTPNAPVNGELPATGFADHNAFIGVVGIEARPWQKYRIRNGRKFRGGKFLPSSVPNIAGPWYWTMWFSATGIGPAATNQVWYSRHLDLKINAGTFFKTTGCISWTSNTFLGNRTPFVTTDPVGSFRLLDYYQ